MNERTNRIGLLLALIGGFILANFVQLRQCAKLPDIYWNSSNPIFRIDNTDHIFDVNKKQHDHDQVDLVCPQPLSQSGNNDGQQKQSIGGQNSTNSEQERYIIYSVSKDEYDNCRLNGPARVVAVCDQRDQNKIRPPVTVTFRSFTPQPNGLEFKAGQDYYFISALINHQNDPQRRFSPCRDQNMKVIFKVCCKPSSSSSSSSSSLGSAQPVVPTNGALMGANGAGRPGGNLATFRPTQEQQVGSAARWPSTIRPSLAPVPQRRPLQDYLSTLAPVTVLPIEVLQPSSEPSNSVQSSTGQMGELMARGESNDIFQNDKPTSSSSSSPAPAPALPAHLQPQPKSAGPYFGRDQAPSAYKKAPVIPFDPAASPDILGRWTPTPLPPEVLQGNWRPSWPQQLSLQVPIHTRPQTRPGPYHPLYSTYAPATISNSGLITVPDQSSSAGFISASPTWLLCPLFALVLLAWWRLRPRSHLHLPTTHPIGIIRS